MTIPPYFSIVVPVFNEAGNLAELHRRLVEVFAGVGAPFELILVDDGSSDGSLEVMRQLAQRDPAVKFLSFSRNFGHEAASTAGLDAAWGQAVVLMDGDLQDPPELIPQLIAKWREGYEVVYAQRRGRAAEPVVVRATSFLFYRLMKRLTAVDIPLDTGDFRLLDQRVVADFRRCRERNRFVRGLLSWVGYRQSAVRFDREERRAGKTKYNSLRRLFLAFDAITGFSVMPLRLSLLLGFMVVILSLAAGLYVTVQKLYFDIPIPGYAFLTVSLYFLGGSMLFVMGIIGEYIGKIYIEVQQRPLYLLREKSGMTGLDTPEERQAEHGARAEW